jgi:hypothetical protein
MDSKLYKTWQFVKLQQPILKINKIEYSNIYLKNVNNVLIFTNEIDTNIKMFIGHYKDKWGFIVSRKPDDIKIPTYKLKVEDFTKKMFKIESKYKYSVVFINTSNYINILKMSLDVLHEQSNLIIKLDLNHVKIDDLFIISKTFKTTYFYSPKFDTDTLFFVCNDFKKDENVKNNILNNMLLKKDDKDKSYLKFLNKFEMSLIKKIEYMSYCLLTK